MFKFQLATKADLREAAIIQQKRRFEDDRKNRIFNARNRVIGVDIEALQMQIEEKRKKDCLKREEDKKYVTEDRRRAVVLNAKAEELEKERARVESEINEYRRKYQKKEDTREFDLNDPNYIQNGLAARVGDDDPRLGISSAQKFQGEDLMCPERLKVQRDQQRAWLQQQISERKGAENDRKMADLQLQKAAEARDRRAQELDAAERHSRQQLQISATRYNQILAASQDCKKQERKREDQQDNLAEIYNCMTSDMLAETRDTGETNLGGNHKAKANYRGMTEDEAAEFERARTEQKKEKLKQIIEEKSMDAKWNQMANSFDRMSMLKQREIDRKRSAMELSVSEENARLAAEQKARKKQENAINYRPTAEYFAQFNTTTR